MEKRRLVRRETNAKGFLHGSIESSLLWLDREIEIHVQNGLSSGWKDRVLVGIVMLAFLNESFINAVGSLCVEGWNRKWKTATRFEKIRLQFLPNLDEDSFPLDQIRNLRELRNEISHTLPEMLDGQVEEVVVTDADLERAVWESFGHSVEDRINLVSYREYREASNAYRDMIRQASGLTDYDLRTSKEVSETYLGEA